MGSGQATLTFSERQAMLNKDSASLSNVFLFILIKQYDCRIQSLFILQQEAGSCCPVSVAKLHQLARTSMTS